MSRPVRTTETTLGGMAVLALSAFGTPVTIGALIAALPAILVAQRMPRHHAARYILGASFVGGLAGAYIMGTVAAPPRPGALHNVIRMIGVIVPRALVQAVFITGLGAILVADVIRWRRNPVGDAPSTLTNGRTLLVFGLAYAYVILITVPGLTETRAKAVERSMISDLHNLAYAQMQYHDSTKTFAPSVPVLDFQSSQDVKLALEKVSRESWTATARSDGITTTCSVSGSAIGGANATSTGPACTRHRRWF